MSETALKIRKQIVGTDLSAVVFVRDYVQLDFDGPKFNALTPITVSSARGTAMSGEDQFRNLICEQIGKVVTDFSIAEQQCAVIGFADGSRISLSFRKKDYPGPEAVIYFGEENLLVVI